MIEYELRIKRGEQAASEILARGRSGRNIIDAIKAMRNASGISLREAKAHVDRMMFRQPAEAVRAAPEAAADRERAASLVASEDTKRLDYLQETGSTVELVPGGHGGLFFRIGGLYRAVHADIRQAIDAARVSAGEAQS